MQPDLELVHIRKGESFAAWMRDYPLRTVRWHDHPEARITDICCETGFSNLSRFNRHFQKIKSMPPLESRSTFATG